MTAYDQLKIARHPKRITSRGVIKQLFPDFLELHGDRQFKDDVSIIGGIASFKGHTVTIIAQEKGIDTEDKIKHNFGMPHPEGYRKALRLMKQAEKFKRPIITFIDTPGAYPGVGAEARGQAQAIANNLKEMMGLKTPVIVVVLSEGGSGGALAIGVGDVILMFEHAIYSVLSPEGFASILYKDAKRAPEAAELMKITSNIIDEIIKEGPGLHENLEIGLSQLTQELEKQLESLTRKPIKRLLISRYEKFRKMGTILERVSDESTN
ncbi:MAG: acetyl-CoA carboxylase carboxyltransferase subunit alpha [Firmicutes bacterium]|nr:acetyl-CoA carboxylase carboxyltransferase subunit alpha [Bacillota bacterium]